MGLKRILLYLCGAAVAASAAPASAQSGSAPIIRRPHYIESGTERWWTVVDSRWGFVRRFNLALADRLDRCPGADAARQAAILRLAPNRFGAVAEDGLSLLRTCDPKTVGNWQSGDPVTVQLWRRVAPKAVLPTPIEKSRAINFQGAGGTSDYDVAYWTADAPREAAEPLSDIFIWGPSRASVVDGCYVQRIVRLMDSSPAGREALERSFAERPDGLAALRSPNCPARLDGFSDDAGKQAFRMAVMRVGATEPGREAYDAAYLGPGGPWAARVARLYRIYDAAHLRPTETDFAMFLEIVRGYTVPEARVQPASDALRLAAPASPAQARRALAAILAPTTAAVRDFELGRAVSYYIDGIGADQLTPDELAAWHRHSGVKASDVGLNDTLYVPCKLIADIPQCQRRGGAPR